MQSLTRDVPVLFLRRVVATFDAPGMATLAYAQSEQLKTSFHSRLRRCIARWQTKAAVRIHRHNQVCARDITARNVPLSQ